MNRVLILTVGIFALWLFISFSKNKVGNTTTISSHNSSSGRTHGGGGGSF